MSLSATKNMPLASKVKQGRLLPILLSVTLVLGGCASTGSSMLGGSSDADPRLTSGEEAEFFSRSGYQACAASAAIGAMACMLSNSSNKAVCAVAAGVAACGVAMGANYYLDQRRGEYANTGERLDAMNQDIQQDTQRVIARTETARSVIAEDKALIVGIEQDIAQKTLNRERAERDLAAIDSNIEILKRDLANMNTKVVEYEEVAELERQEATPEEMVEVEHNIQKMRDQVLALQQEVDTMYSMRSAITLG